MAALTKIIGLYFLVSLPLSGQSLVKTTKTFLLGDEKVWIHIYEQPGADITLINLHDNENTAAAAGLSFLKKYGGRFIELQHGRGREVVVRQEERLSRFDPNRMFSAQGLRASLSYFKNNSDFVYQTAGIFRDSLINILRLDSADIILSLHNNSANKMTIYDFRPGEWYGDDTRETAIFKQRDPDNFFIINDDRLFTDLSARGFNVALKVDSPPDRGMFMDYAHSKSAVCITIETEHGQLQEQLKMLEALWQILKQRRMI